MDFPLTTEQKVDLKKQQKEAKKNKNTFEYIKISVVLFLDLGFEIKDIAEGLGIDIGTVSNYNSRYKKSNNFNEYLLTHYKQNIFTKLTKKELEKLKIHLDEKLYTTCKGIANYIIREFGKSYTPNGLCLLLKRLGYVHKQTKLVPGKVDIEAQKEFVKHLIKLKKKLKKDKKLYFVDGVYPTHNTVSVRVWTRKGKERKVKSNTGRERLNINGAMNGQDSSEIIYTEEKTINKETTIKLFNKILSQNQDIKKIYLVCDNARYYKNKLMGEYLQKPKKLKILYLPPYSPNLNLIERLWRLMRSKKLGSEYYEDYKSFKISLIDFFDNIEDYKDELQSLMKWKFHFLNN